MSHTGQAAKKTNWTPICLIGCGIMLLLAIIISVGIYLLGKSATEELTELSTSLTDSIEIEGFDPSTVDSTMLPAFYSFMIALAEDNPQGMYQWMAPELKQKWSPEESWTVSPSIKHLDYKLSAMTTQGDGTVAFTIDETIYDEDDSEQMTFPWDIHFKQINGEWLVTFFE